MFNLIHRDIVSEALVNAQRESNEDAALARFLETVRDDNATIDSLRATYRRTVEELCDQHQIQDPERRRAIQLRLLSDFPRNLQRTAREYLRDEKRVTTLSLASN